MTWLKWRWLVIGPDGYVWSTHRFKCLAKFAVASCAIRGHNCYVAGEDGSPI